MNVLAARDGFVCSTDPFVVLQLNLVSPSLKSTQRRGTKLTCSSI